MRYARMRMRASVMRELCVCPSCVRDIYVFLDIRQPTPQQILPSGEETEKAFMMQCPRSFFDYRKSVDVVDTFKPFFNAGQCFVETL